MEYLSEEEYKKVLALVPIPCVDFVVTHQRSFLLGKRVNAPARGQWFVPGGRILRGETMDRAIERKFKEEIGLSIPSSRAALVHAEETIFSEVDPVRHTVNAVYKVELTDEERSAVRPDVSQTSEVRWFDALDKAWHPYVRHCLMRAGFSADV